MLDMLTQRRLICLEDGVITDTIAINNYIEKRSEELHNNFFFIRDLKKLATAAEIVKKKCVIPCHLVLWHRENGNFEFFF